jgi:hypothetical protein
MSVVQNRITNNTKRIKRSTKTNTNIKVIERKRRMEVIITRSGRGNMNLNPLQTDVLILKSCTLMMVV